MSVVQRVEAITSRLVWDAKRRDMAGEPSLIPKGARKSSRDDKSVTRMTRVLQSKSYRHQQATLG